ncbi:helix-turn-helix domain-containing protein [Streptomyces aureoversilis]|uniref:Helix-turn-helix domain-containing protein n=1 Tax=Streptomyces aureoversilis TaxID=67277 RepID=A0ABV9ZT27_9ACTN
MPGRLTRQDRRRIAAGLGEGLSYTEIARRLDRSTSTVTREVMRNGGPVEYRADPAHQAAARRARRRGRAGAGAPQVAASATGIRVRDGEAVRDYEERLTQLFVDMGVPRMMSRILACIFTTDSGSVTAADLVRRLSVSPASISKAVGRLAKQELIRRERDARERRDRYVIDDDVWHRAMLANIRFNTALAATARDGAGVLGAQSPAGARLNNMGQLLEHVSHDLLRSVEHWQHVLSARRAPQTRDDGSPAPGAGSRCSLVWRPAQPSQ